MTISSLFAFPPGTKPTALALERHLRERIRSGAFNPGMRLPPVREVAWALGCAPGTVARAYQALERQGLIHGEVGRGTFVGEGRSVLGLPLEGARHAGTADLSVTSFLMEPADDLLAEALATVAARLGAGVVSLSYESEAGVRADREAALPFLARWRDDLTPEDVVITSGAQAVLAAASSALVPRGGTVACDALVYPGVRSAAAMTGLKPCAVEMDAEGMIPEALDAACRRHPVGLLFVMPSVQNPTGRAMPSARRVALAEVAARHGLTVIEDEVYGFMADPGIGPRAEGFSRLLPERTVLATSLSKCVAPALRVGYAAGPGALVRRIAAAQNAMQLMVSPALTAAASLVLSGDRLARRIAAIRAGVAVRADHVAATWPEVDRAALGGGLALLPLPSEWAADGFAAEAEALGVKVSPARYFAVEARLAPNAVRLSLGAVAGEERFRRAIATLASLRERPYSALPAAP